MKILRYVKISLSEVPFSILILTVFGVFFIFHQDAYPPYYSPKNIAFIILAVICVDVFLLFKIKDGNFKLTITWIELLLLVRLAWAVITNPQMVVHPSDLGFWLLLSLTALSIITRNIIHESGANSAQSSTGELRRKSKSENYSKLFIRALWIVGVVQAVIGIAQWYIYRDFYSPLIKTTMIGTIGTPNSFGLFLAVASVAVLIELKNHVSLRIKLLAVASLAVMHVALAMTRSRGAMLALAITVGVLLLQKIKVTRKVKSYLAAVVLVAVGISVYLLYQMNPESAEGRRMAARVSFPMILDHPIFGIGQGNFAKEYLNYQAKFFEDSQNAYLAYKAANLKQVHNEYLQAFFETGILGGLLFLALWSYPVVVRMFTKSNQDEPDSHGDMIFLLMPVLIHSAVDSVLHVLSISILAYTLLGFVPVKSTQYEITIRNGIVKWGIISVVLAASTLIIAKYVNQYPGYISWASGINNTMQQRWKGAIADYAAALERLPQKSELQFYLGSAMVMNGEYSKGIYFLNQSLEGFNDRNIYLSLSLAYLRLQQYEKAEQYAKKGLAMFPDHLAPHLCLAEIYYHQGKHEEAKKELRKCILRDTAIQSRDVEGIANDAMRLWQQFFPAEAADTITLQ